MGMHLDGSGVVNGVAGGIRHREIHLLRAILRYAHGRMSLQGEITEAFSGTAPMPGGAQSIAAIVFGGGIAELFLREDRLAGQDDSAEFTGGS